MAKTVMYAQFVGIPLTIILSLIALFKKEEKKMLATFGLILVTVLIIVIGFFLYLGTHFAP
ncbi:hypothetical protein [Terrihalobacillus insolitus]|uniref:hypothetical protein n=1 Tax=Terrihalobacillus insolitus TaxID=2950438 RepID=UPI0023411814|nr:hypothetical protein [Terrihalobacillus insolitus]MDC3414744.1 hypothetical protein [Terrihalobacillus insolitus]